jgi:uncharacterized protein
MASKTSLLAAVKQHDWPAVQSALEEVPKLRDVRDRRGRSWLHLCCGVRVAATKLKPAAGIKTADVLLDAGLGLDDAAFTDGPFRATPLWYTISWGRNLALAKHLLARGADPEHCMHAAAFNDDVAAIELLVRHGARIDPDVEDASPFLFAVQWSRFAAAEALLAAGADVNFRNSKQTTALHTMLKKGSAPKHFRTIAKYRPRLDLEDRDGATAGAIMRRKRDPFFRKLALELGA